MHIPKTGGSTIEAIMKRKSFPGNAFFLDSTNSLANLDRLYSLGEEELEKISLLYGHFDYGLHGIFSTPSTYVTMLRNPMDRVISHFFYVKNSPEHFLYEKVKHLHTLSGYLTAELSTELDNGQVRMLAGIGSFNGQTVPFGEVTKAHLEQAVANMENHFLYVGLQEYFDVSLLQMGKMLHLGKMSYHSLNINKKKPGTLKLDSGTLEILRKYNYYDLQLYDYAFQRFLANREVFGKASLLLHRLDCQSKEISFLFSRVWRRLQKELKILQESK